MYITNSEESTHETLLRKISKEGNQLLKNWHVILSMSKIQGVNQAVNKYKIKFYTSEWTRIPPQKPSAQVEPK